MELEYVPLLQIQRDLHRIPRGMDRFREYLRVMLNDENSDVRLPPLVMMNPMGKDHVTALLDALLALDADSVAARAVEDASARLRDLSGTYKVGLVIADDAMGGWTNRYASEFGLLCMSPAALKRSWLTGVLWSSGPPAALTVRQAVLTAVYRTAHFLQHGSARTLRELMLQEGYAMAMAECAQPTLEPDDLAYTSEVIVPHLEAQDQPTLMGCLFGDTAARSLGYPLQGLSERAGLALALHQARCSQLASGYPLNSAAPDDHKDVRHHKQRLKYENLIP